MCLLILQAGIYRRVLINAVDVDGKFKINGVSNDIFKTHKKVDGSILYDALDLSSSPVNKTSILKINNIDILAPLNFKTLVSYVYDKTDVDIGLRLKADKH